MRSAPSRAKHRRHGNGALSASFSVSSPSEKLLETSFSHRCVWIQPGPIFPKRFYVLAGFTLALLPPIVSCLVISQLSSAALQPEIGNYCLAVVSPGYSSSKCLKAHLNYPNYTTQRLEHCNGRSTRGMNTFRMLTFSTSDREGRYSPHNRCMDGWMD